MMFGKEHTVLFVLLRAGLWERAVEATDLFPLSDDCWEAVLSLARRQTVTGLVYRGLNRLPEEFFPSESVLLRWVAEADRIERVNMAVDRAVCELFEFFHARHLHPVLLKGQGVARLYECPSLREAGDIDLYFPDRTEFLRAGKLVQEHHIRLERQPDGSSCYLWGGIEVEHHPCLCDLHNPSSTGMVKALEQTDGFALLDISPEAEVWVPSPELNLLQLNAHILKHAMGRGIGLRQFCDMARACHRLHGAVDADVMEYIYRKAGLARWSRLLHAFLVEALGLPEDELPYRDKPVSSRVLSEIIFEGGNFGQYGSLGNGQAQAVWTRKFRTAYSFARNMGFSCRYAPGEAFRAFAHLFKGQFKC